MSYTDIKFKMLKARDQYMQYFGVAPVAFTVPTDYYDETGYKAIDDAGFKIFATHSSNEPNPSNIPVDLNGRKDINGMYRIPAGSDVCEWNDTDQTWGDVIDISKPASITDYCKYHDAWTEVVYNEIASETCDAISAIGVATISLHPDAFVDSNGKPDLVKIQKVEPIIKWIKSYATPMTFEQWYNYISTKK